MLLSRTTIVNRRQFVRTCAALAGTALTPHLLRAEDKKPFGPFIVGAQSYCFRKFKLEPALKQIQALGLAHVEFFRDHVPTTSTPDQIKAVLRMCGDYGVTPIAFGVERFTKDHNGNKKLFDFGKQLGIKHLSADPDPDSFDSLDKLCDEFKITIAIHPHGPAGGGKLHRWYSAEAIMMAVKDHHPLIGSCLDTGHLIRAAQLGAKLDPAQQVRVMGARNFGMHLKDHDNEKQTDVVYGKGPLDVAAVLRALKEVAFKGYISVEYEANPDNPSPDMAACLEILKAAARQVG